MLEQELLNIMAAFSRLQDQTNAAVALRGRLFDLVEDLRGTSHEAGVWTHIEPTAGNHIVLAYDKLTEVVEALKDALTAMKD